MNLGIGLLGFLTHFSFIFLFDYWGVTTLSLLNIFSSLLWAWAIVEVLRGFTYRSVYIATSEILVHAVIATAVLGAESGFDLYLLPVAAWLAYHPDVKFRYALVTGTACILLWVFGRFYWAEPADSGLAAETLASMLRMNASIAGFVFISAIITARLMVERQRRLLSEQALRDQLTGLYNRHYVTDFIRQLEQDGLTNRRSFALIMADLDHFKSINDRYGHETGDKVLQAFSTYLQEYVREDDLVCRWGGEEFIVIMPKCELQLAIQKAEAIRAAVADGMMRDEQGRPISMTASFGVTLSHPGERFRDLVSRADQLLYQAKESGRNRVVAQ